MFAPACGSAPEIARPVSAPPLSVARLTGFLLLAAMVATAAAARADFDPEAVFTTRCGACHTVGQGKDVGPDLAGVTDRHPREWLIPFIQSSQTVIRGGDPVANELFRQFGGTKMPDHPYSAEEILQLLDYIEAGGPGPKVPPVRPAQDATSDEIALGHSLFFGLQPLEQGGAACADCHSVSGVHLALTHSLGGDLRDVYDRYHDREMTRALIQMSDPVMGEAYGDKPLTNEENFALKAYLAKVAIGEQDESGHIRSQAASVLPWAGLSLAAVLGAFGDGRRRWRLHRSKRETRQQSSDAVQSLETAG